MNFPLFHNGLSEVYAYMGLPSSLLPPNCLYVNSIGRDKTGLHMKRFGITGDIKIRQSQHEKEFAHCSLDFIMNFGEYDPRSAETELRRLVRPRAVSVQTSGPLSNDCFVTSPEENDQVLADIINEMRKQFGAKIVEIHDKNGSIVVAGTNTNTMECKMLPQPPAPEVEKPTSTPLWTAAVDPAVFLEAEREKTKQIEAQTKQMMIRAMCELGKQLNPTEIASLLHKLVDK